MRSLAVGLIGVAAVALALLAWWSRPGATAVPEFEPPIALHRSSWWGNDIRLDGGGPRRDGVEWSSLERGLELVRHHTAERCEDVVVTKLRVDTPYEVIDVAITGERGELATVYALGGFANGDACIERLAVAPIDLDAPTAELKSVVTERRELLRTARFGHVRALAVEPDGTALHLLTLESASLLRLDLATLAITTELTREEEPALAECEWLRVREHEQRGRMLHAMSWRQCVVDPDDRTLELVDRDRDGRFEARTLVSSRDWDARYVGRWITF